MPFCVILRQISSLFPLFFSLLFPLFPPLALYLQFNNIFCSILLGLASAHIGMTLNHCANHGGLTTSPSLNYFFGFANDLIGGSSLIWSYHHHVSHHIYTNSVHRDQDVFSSFPLIRFDERLPGSWYHRFQHIYVPILFPFLFGTK